MNDFSVTKGEDRAKRDLTEEILDEYADGDLDDLMGAVGDRTTKRIVHKKKKKKKDDLEPKFLDMYSSIYSMRQEMDRIRKPMGTRDNPVRTCRDLYYGHPQLKDGQWPLINIGFIMVICILF